MITVGVDGSDNSFRALEWALDEAASHRTDLHGLAAGDRPETGAVLDETYASVVQGRDVRVPVSLGLVAEPPSASLAAESARSDLLVIGRRGVGGFRELLAGSTVDACTQHADCPVVVVPSHYESGTTGRIVVGVDDSEGAAEALRWAMQEALSTNRPLVAVMAYGVSPLRSDDVQPFADRAAESLDEVVDKAGSDIGRADLEIERVVLHGRPAAALLEFSHPNDLIVVGSRGRSPFTAALLGSTGRVLVEHAQCPVVVVRGAH